LIAQFVRRRGLDHVIAIAVCGLMLFFAVGSKVAAYHSKELAARSIAATKVWQAKNVGGDLEQVDTSATVQMAVELVFLLSLCLVIVEPLFERERSFGHLPVKSFAPLAKRPPPTL
jgi:hypothetical protein